MGCNEVKDNKNLPKILMVFEEGNDQQQAYCLKIKENFRYPKDVLYDIKSVINETFSIKLKIKNNIYDIQTSFNDSDIDMKNALQNMYDLLNKYENINPKFDDKEISLYLDKNEEEDILERERLREMKNEVLENQKRLRDNEDKKDDKEDIKNEEKKSNEINEEKNSNEKNEEIRGNEDFVKNEEIKKEQETNNKINEVLEDMCIYGNIMKKEIQEEKEKNTIDLKKKYDTKKQNIDDLNDKIGKVQAQLEAKKRENKENEEKYGDEEDQFRNLLLTQEKELKRLEYIIKKFVPPEEKERIEKCLEFSEKEGIYKINGRKALLNNYKQNIDKIKKMKKMKLKDPKSPTIIEDTINLQLEKPDAFCIEFTLEPPKEFSDSIKNVLNDDDRDIFYYDKERKIQTNSLRPEMLGVPDSKKEEVTSAKQPKKKGV